MFDPWGFESYGSSAIGNPNDYEPQYPDYEVGALTVTPEEKNALQEQVAIFHIDVDAALTTDMARIAVELDQCAGHGMTWDQNKAVCIQTPDPTGASYPGTIITPLSRFRNDRLAPFLVRWEAFLTAWGSSIGVADFEELKLNFQDLLGEWNALGQTTAAKAPDVAVPGPIDDIKKSIPYLGAGLAIVGLAVAAYLVGPLLVTAAVARKR